MDPDLVGATGLEPTRDQRRLGGLGEDLIDLIAGTGFLAGRHYRHAGRVPRRPSDGGVYQPP